MLILISAFYTLSLTVASMPIALANYISYILKATSVLYVPIFFFNQNISYPRSFLGKIIIVSFLLLIPLLILNFVIALENKNPFFYLLADVIGLLVTFCVFLAVLKYKLKHLIKRFDSILIVFSLLNCSMVILTFYGVDDNKIFGIHPVVFAYILSKTLNAKPRSIYFAFYFLILLIFITMILFSDSRGSFYSATLLIIAYLIYSKSYVVLGFVISAFFTLGALVNVILSKVFLGEGKVDGSTYARIYEVQMQLESLRNAEWYSWLIGMGSGALYPDLDRVYGVEFLHHAHITPVFILYKFGIFALFLFFMLVYMVPISLFIANLKRSRNWTREHQLMNRTTFLCCSAYALQITFVGQEFLWNPILAMIFATGVKLLSEIRNI